MPKKTKKTIAFADMTPETKARVATWLSDRLGEMEGEEKSIAEEEGRDFLPALRGLVEHLRPKS